MVNITMKIKIKIQKSKYIKKEEKVIEKPKAIEKGNLLVEENLIKIMLDSKKYREIILLKINEEDFLEKDSKEIVNWLIKNKDLDKITIDKIKSLNISEEYIKGLESISLDNLDLNNIKNIDDIIKNIRKNSLNEKINILLKEQIDIEKNKDVKDTKEVDSKIMEIALKIVELRRQLQRL